MAHADLRNGWIHLVGLDLDARVEDPAIVPHEETDLHRVFCDEHFCLEAQERKPAPPTDS